MPVYWELQTLLGKSPPRVLLLHLLGLRTHGLAQALALPLCLTAVLYAGPLLAEAAGAGGMALRMARVDMLRDVQQLRNLVVAPLTEEWAFRACLAPLWLLQGVSAGRLVLLLPLAFGIAHAHHAYDLVVHRGFPVRLAAMQVLLQAAYTTLFGWYATFLLLRTGHLAAPVAAHALCNYLGLPNFGAVLARRGSAMALLAGVAAFAGLLGPLTRAELYGGAGLPPPGLGFRAALLSGYDQ